MKKNFIYILVLIAVLLLIGNILTRILSEDEKEEIVITELDVSEIDSIFLRSVNEFNLDSAWVKRVPIQVNENDSLDHVFKVDLPKDLPPVVVLSELRDQFINEPVEIISDEKSINGYTTVSIYSNNKLKLQASLDVKPGIYRRHSKFALVLSSFNDVSKDEQQNIYRSILDLNILLIPSEESDSLIHTISENEKTYSALITDKNEESIYHLDPSNTKTMMQQAVRYNIWNYPDAHLYLIDNSAEIFNSTSFNYVKDQFSERDIRLRPVSEFLSLPEELSEAKSLLSFYIESGMGKEGKILIMPALLFDELEGILLAAKKMGSKFYTPKRLEMLQSN